MTRPAEVDELDAAGGAIALGVITAFYGMPDAEARSATLALIEELTSTARDDAHRGFLIGSLIVNLGGICATGAQIIDDAVPGAGRAWLAQIGERVASWR